MADIFNFQKLQTSLIKETRTLKITLKKQDQNYHHFDTELLFELESILAWASTKIEIHSILLNSETDAFSHGICPKKLKNYSKQRIEKLQIKMQTINQALMLLPQTVIVDLGCGAKNIGTELALAADIRIGDDQAYIIFDHSKIGLIPTSGGVAQLGTMVGHANARSWVLTAQKIPSQKLINAGFLYQTYKNQKERNTITQEILYSIADQAPVQRVQSKLGITEAFRSDIEALYEFERKISKAAMISEDWKSESKKENFPAKHYKTAVKLSLIKSEENKAPN